MKAWILAAAAALSLCGAASAKPPPLPLPPPLPPAAVFTDPPADAAHPARSEVLHIPSNGVTINGLIYIAAGPGPHPTMVLLHGLPGNEKNLDLAQAVRRAGWNVVTFNYRGSWGSPGTFSFTGIVGDAKAVLAYVRNPEVAGKLQIDPRRLVLAGHSMGGWGAAVVAARDMDLQGAILISAGDMAAMGAAMPLKDRVALAADNAETLSGVTPESMADELGKLPPQMDFDAAAPGLARAPLLVLSADDGLAPMSDKLVAAVRAQHGKVTAVHAATDHSWNTRRIFLESQVIRWLQALPAH
ncbi:MAG: histidine triad protein [Phenylobacterium sp.]|nr:histidine triad protein [Phenylobacterium sp.]